jgi:hypothetical protein
MEHVAEFEGWMLGNLHVGCIPMTAPLWSSERVPTSQIGADDVPGDGPTRIEARQRGDSSVSRAAGTRSMSVTGTWRRNAATLIRPRSPGVMSAVRRRGGQVGFRTGACVVSALRQDASGSFWRRMTARRSAPRQTA